MLEIMANGALVMISILMVKFLKEILKDTKLGQMGLFLDHKEDLEHQYHIYQII